MLLFCVDFNRGYPLYHSVTYPMFQILKQQTLHHSHLTFLLSYNQRQHFKNPIYFVNIVKKITKMLQFF